MLRPLFLVSVGLREPHFSLGKVPVLHQQYFPEHKMESDNIVHLDQLRRLRRSKGVSRDLGGRLKRLTTTCQLCAALFAHLDASEPRVPVQATVAAWMRHRFRIYEEARRSGLLRLITPRSCPTFTEKTFRRMPRDVGCRS
jgi:hypothetical protein